MAKAPKRKQITLTVTLSMPAWLTAAQAKRELRTRVNDLTMWGFTTPSNDFTEMEVEDFRIRKIAPAPR